MSDKVWRVYSVIEKPDKDGKEREPFWHNVGTAFPHKSGVGFNILLEVMPIPVDGVCKLVMREIEPKEAEADDAPKKKTYTKR